MRWIDKETQAISIYSTSFLSFAMCKNNCEFTDYSLKHYTVFFLLLVFSTCEPYLFVFCDGKHCDSRDCFVFIFVIVLWCCVHNQYQHYLLNEKIAKDFSVKEKTKRDIAGWMIPVFYFKINTWFERGRERRPVWIQHAYSVFCPVVDVRCARYIWFIPNNHTQESYLREKGKECP